MEEGGGSCSIQVSEMDPKLKKVHYLVSFMNWAPEIDLSIIQFDGHL